MSSEQRWVLRRKASPEFQAQNPDLDPMLAAVLFARKIDSPDAIGEFLRAPSPLPPPDQLPDVQTAVERLLTAIREGQLIVVYGDFDVDGVSSTSLLLTVLRALGANVRSYIPDRFSEAYGLNTPALEKLRQEGVDLVVTVDCGIRSVREVKRAGELGLDMIITDHHSVPDELPPALAVINPKRTDSAYPFPDLAGVGVAYRLAQALLAAAGPAGISADGLESDALLDLVALGTVADVVPLTDENRVLAQRGLERIRQAARPGIRALLRVSGSQPDQVDSGTIGFRLGPRINAAGRLRHAQMGLDLLLAESDEQAQPLAEALDAVNQERQQLLTRQVERAIALLTAPVDDWVQSTWASIEAQSERAAEQFGADRQQLRDLLSAGMTTASEIVGQAALPPLLFVYDADFHEGIVGLIASRLVNEYYRPSLVMRHDGELVRGSARSIEGFHVTHALDACSDLLLRYGGHSQAAGFSLEAKNLEALQHRMVAYADEHLGEDDFLPRLFVDAIVPLDAIGPQTPAALARMEPFGEGNPEPALATLGVQVDALRAVGQEGRHLKLQLSASGRSLSAIAFRLGHLIGSLQAGDTIDIVYRPTINQWNGQTSLQLEVQAVRPAKT